MASPTQGLKALWMFVEARAGHDHADVGRQELAHGIDDRGGKGLDDERQDQQDPDEGGDGTGGVAEDRRQPEGEEPSTVR